MMEFFDWFNAATAAVTLASFLANFTRTDADNRAVAWASKLVHAFALNWGGEAAPKT
jgi:hypothetical protein